MRNENQTVRIDGEKIFLKSIQKDTICDVVTWRNAPHVKKMLFSQDEVTYETHLSWLNNYVMTGKCAQFIIYDRKTFMAVGTTFLKNIDLSHAEAEFGIFIGLKEFLGKGGGAEATRLLLHYAFQSLSFQSIYLSVLEENARAFLMYKKLGFTIENYDHQAYIRDGQPYAVYTMRLLKDRWIELCAS